MQTDPNINHFCVLFTVFVQNHTYLFSLVAVGEHIFDVRGPLHADPNDGR